MKRCGRCRRPLPPSTGRGREPGTGKSAFSRASPHFLHVTFLLSLTYRGTRDRLGWGHALQPPRRYRGYRRAPRAEARLEPQAWQDERGGGVDVEDEGVEGVGRITRELVVYVRSLKYAHRVFLLPLVDGQLTACVRPPDGRPAHISLDNPDGSISFHSTMSAILSQDLKTTLLSLVLPSIILSIADHLPDRDLSQLLVTMADRPSLPPTSLTWLDHWQSILTMPDIFSPARSSTQQHAMEHLTTMRRLC